MPAPSAFPRLLSQQHQTYNSGRSSPASFNPLKRSRTPLYDDRRDSGAAFSTNGAVTDMGAVDDHRRTQCKRLYTRSEGLLNGLFARDARGGTTRITAAQPEEQGTSGIANTQDIPTIKEPPTAKRKARAIDEDDYGDEDEDEEEEAVGPPEIHSPLRAKTSGSTLPNGLFRATSAPTPATQKPPDEGAKTSEEARKQLEEEKKAAEEAAKESSQTLFYTLENDRDAMLEQQKLDELDRQVEAEAANNAGGSGATQKGTLSSANLGASSLTLKYLIRRIDAKRTMVEASDQQLRTLMSEVRKNRSKWASEDKVGQEELYEAAERVLMELKAKTEWSGPFLTKVNKREAPDYYAVIKHPMDLGTMMKKLKGLQYQSKKDFVDDLDMIWANCLRYNNNPEHFLRKKAEHMKKESARYIPLIPDVVIRNRAEVEAEERRQQTDFDDAEDSDEEPLRNARGRKAPGKSSKKGTTTARQASVPEEDTTPAPEARTQPASAIANLKNEFARDNESGSQSGFLTPPPRMGTPVGGGVNGIFGSAAAGSQGDFSEIEGMDVTMNGVGQVEDLDQEDEDYKTWKSVTKKDRAAVAAERHLLFRGDKINNEEPALLRSKAGMRRWMKLQKYSTGDQSPQEGAAKAAEQQREESSQGATLSEDIESAQQLVLPDYYDPLAGVPQLEDRLIWQEDADGQVIDQREECLRIVPSSAFMAPDQGFASKIEKNLRQMQETRKIVAKIAIVKQMQLQTQTYQNQFQKYDPEPFTEKELPPIVVSDEGPIMSSWVYRAAMQRSIAKIFYHAGFEEFHPSALEAMTDVVGQYFGDLVSTLTTYSEAPKVTTAIPEEATAPVTVKGSAAAMILKAPQTESRKFKPRFSQEAALLHMLDNNGHDLDSLEAYSKEEIERLSSKLETNHSRTRDYLAELLRPALDPSTAGTDGAGVFQEGSEQFVGGDFAEDIGEDYFGFRELGLDKEFGIAGMSVPLHLLQSRLSTAYQPANAAIATTTGVVMAQPDPWPALTLETLDEQIGIIKDFFMEKLGKTDQPQLIEDEELPPKQRFPRPRLPPTGKISSPRKRPIREQQAMARKKRRLEVEAEKEREAAAANAAAGGADAKTGAQNGAATISTTQQEKTENQDTHMVNGDSTAGADVDAAGDAEGDEDTSFLAPTISASLNTPNAAAADSEDATPLAARKLTIKPLANKVKLDMPGTMTETGGKSGDPVKPPPKPAGNTEDNGGGADHGDDGGGANGILSPESMPIAAH